MVEVEAGRCRRGRASVVLIRGRPPQVEPRRCGHNPGDAIAGKLEVRGHDDDGALECCETTTTEVTVSNVDRNVVVCEYVRSEGQAVKRGLGGWDV